MALQDGWVIWNGYFQNGNREGKRLTYFITSQSPRSRESVAIDNAESATGFAYRRPEEQVK
jgi:hypothetical protein